MTVEIFSGRGGRMIARLSALLLLLPAAALAQTVRGSILDPATGAHLAGVEIRVLDRSGQLLLSASSDAQGAFDLPLLSGDGVRLQFARIGYQPTSSDLLFIGKGEVRELEIRLTASAVPLKPVTAVASRPASQLVEFYERAARNQRLGQGRIWTRADLARDPRTLISRRLGTVPSRGGCKRREVYIDGMPLSITPPTGLAQAYRPPTNERTMELAHVSVDLEPSPAPPPGTDVVDWLAPPEDVEGIEVYRDNEIPTQFNPDGELCQVTLIWRKAPALAPPPHYGVARTALVVVGSGALLGWLLSLIH